MFSFHVWPRLEDELCEECNVVVSALRSAGASSDNDTRLDHLAALLCTASGYSDATVCLEATNLYGVREKRLNNNKQTKKT